MQYCGITKLLRYEQIVLKHHFATYFDTKLQIKLMAYILLLVATVSHSYYTSLNVHLGTQKSIYVEKNTYISTSRYNGIQKIRRYQKPILRYNYTTGILLNTTHDNVFACSLLHRELQNVCRNRTRGFLYITSYNMAALSCYHFVNKRL